MNHARVKELKGGAGGKTTSRRAQRLGRGGNSPMASLMASPASSAAPSRVASDVSDAEFDDPEDEVEFDDTASLFASSDIDDGSATGGSGGAPTFNPDALIEQLQDRKRNNGEARERFLEAYIGVMRTRYADDTHDWLEPTAQSLINLFLRDANRGPTARERLLSLQAFCLTVSTAYTLDSYNSTKAPLQQILVEDDDEECRVWALYSLCATAAFSGVQGAHPDAIVETMEFLLEIVESDGGSIEAFDEVHVVITALQCWCFVASYCDDLSEFADTALDVFVDQLDSADLEIQTTAGAAIAFIFETARAHEEDTGEAMELPYSPERLLPRIRKLAKLSSKSVSRRDRRTLREGLVGVATSLERGVGPGYSTALYVPASAAEAQQGEREYGYRRKLRFNDKSALIDTWALEFRINMLKVIFRGSLHRHAFDNDNVSDCLEDANFRHAEAAGDDDGHKRSKKSKMRRKGLVAEENYD